MIILITLNRKQTGLVFASCKGPGVEVGVGVGYRLPFITSIFFIIKEKTGGNISHLGSTI